MCGQNVDIVFLLKQDENGQKSITDSEKIKVNLSVKNIKLQAKFLCIRSWKRSYKGWNSKQKISSAIVWMNVAEPMEGCKEEPV